MEASETMVEKVEPIAEVSKIPKRVQNLIVERQDGILPKIPSAQLWRKMTESERKSVKDLLAASGEDPDEVLEAHWPKTPEINRRHWRNR